MLLEILRKKPEKVVEFMIYWLENEGRAHEDGFSYQMRENSRCKENSPPIESEKNLLDKDLQLSPKSDHSNESDQSRTETEENLDEVDDFIVTKLQKRLSKKKNGISAEVYGQYNREKDFVPRQLHKTAEQEALIRGILGKSFMFNSLNSKEQEIVVQAMDIKNYNKGDFVIK